MAQKRMFSLQVTDTDKFLDMSASAQALYFHLGMHGDDDGFVGSPRKIARTAGCNDDDLRLLAAKGYIIPFESGVVVITDWNINNTLKNDRYHPTLYSTEKSRLTTDNAGRLTLGNSQETTWNQNGTILEPEHNLTKPNKTKPNRENKAATPPHTRFSPPSVEDVRIYCLERGNGLDAERFCDYYAANGWIQGKGKPIRDWRAAVRTWERHGGRKVENKAPFVYDYGDTEWSL